MSEARGQEAWWQASPDRVAAAVFRAIKLVQDASTERLDRMERLAAAYGGATYTSSHAYMIGAAASGWFANMRQALLPEERITLNVIRSVVDTATARYARNARRAMFLTRGGTIEQMQRAQKLDKFVEGVKRESGYDDGSIVAFRDGALFGTSFVVGETARVREQPRLRLRPALATHLLVDEAEGWRRAPRQCFLVDFVTREELVSRYPDKEALIDAAGIGDLRSVGPYGIADLRAVVSAWHLRSGHGDTDGRRVVAVETGALEDGAWPQDQFDHCVFRYSIEPDGFYGVGIAETIRGIQIEINKLLQRVQDGLRAFAVPRVTYEEGTIDERHLRGSDGALADIIKRQVGSQPPTFWAPSVFPVEVYAQIDRLFNYAHEIVGLTTMATSGQVPSGVTAAIAIETIGTIQNDRFRAMERLADQALHVEPAALIVRMARRLAEEASEKKEDYTISARGRGRIDRVTWKEAALDEDDFVIERYPVSKLPSDPAGLLEYVSELEAKGYITHEAAMRLAETPDVEGEMRIALAPIDFADEVAMRLLNAEKVDPPDVVDATPFLLARLSATYQRAKLDGAGEAALGRMRLYMAQAEMMLAARAEPPAAPVPNVGPSAPAPPGPTNGAAERSSLAPT